jgi:hypothetical protein
MCAFARLFHIDDLLSCPIANPAIMDAALKNFDYSSPVSSITIADSFDKYVIESDPFYEAMSSNTKKGMVVFGNQLNTRNQYMHNGRFLYYFNESNQTIVFASKNTYVEVMDELRRSLIHSMLTKEAPVNVYGILFKTELIDTNEVQYTSWNVMMTALREIIQDMDMEDADRLRISYLKINILFRRFVQKK